MPKRSGPVLGAQIVLEVAPGAPDAIAMADPGSDRPKRRISIA